MRVALKKMEGNGGKKKPSSSFPRRSGLTNLRKRGPEGRDQLRKKKIL